MSNVSGVGDYSHRRHVGNVGDVWKHVAWLAALDGLSGRPRRIFDTHAGEGAYRLGRTGEWTAGWGRLASGSWPGPVAALQRRVAELAKRRWELPPAGDGSREPTFYPGSPVLSASGFRPGDALTVCEAHPEAAVLLKAALAGSPAEVVAGDGYAALAAWAPAADTDRIVLIDPPYVDREEWERVPTAVAATLQRLPGTRFVVWYPIKAFTRPHQLQHALRKAGVSATAYDLISTPIELRRNALAGSGILVVNPPDGLGAALLSAAAALGPALATRPPAWELRVTAW